MRFSLRGTQAIALHHGHVGPGAPVVAVPPRRSKRSPVSVDYGAGNPRRQRAGQEQHTARDVFGFPEAAQRNPSRDVMALRLMNHAVQRNLCAVGSFRRHRVDAFTDPPVRSRSRPARRSRAARSSWSGEVTGRRFAVAALQLFALAFRLGVKATVAVGVVAAVCDRGVCGDRRWGALGGCRLGRQADEAPSCGRLSCAP